MRLFIRRRGLERALRECRDSGDTGAQGKALKGFCSLSAHAETGAEGAAYGGK